MEETTSFDTSWVEIPFSSDIGVLEARISKTRGSTFSFASFSSCRGITRQDKRHFEILLACRYCGQLCGDKEKCCQCRTGSKHSKVGFLFSPLLSEIRPRSERFTYREALGDDRKKVFAYGTIPRDAINERVSTDLAQAIISALPSGKWMSSRPTNSILAKFHPRFFGFHAKKISKVYVFVR